MEHLNPETKIGLSSDIVEDSKMRNFCENEFNEPLSETAYMLSRNSVTKETVEIDWEQIGKLREMTGQPVCEQCSPKSQNYTQKQIDIMQSLQIYDGGEGREKKEDLPEDIVESICELIANNPHERLNNP